MPLNEQERLLRIPLGQIIPNPRQPRRRFKKESLQNLAQSIRVQGIIQPLIVRKSSSGENLYELVAGERRWRATQLTDILEVEVIVKEIEEDDLLEVALLENIQREDLTPIEEAACYRELLEQHGYTQEELARRIGKDRSTIANLIRLLQLPSAIQNDLEEFRLTIGHTRPLLALHSPEEQLRVREQVLKYNWSVRQTEKAVKILTTLMGKDRNASSTKKQTVDDKDLKIQLMTLETELQRHLGTKVSIKHHRSGKGSISLEYYSLDDFDRLYSMLKSS
ncbi:MAG: ParB/RepB/Spo0J family partition protein [SAR324 cluster bacterium]|nr:ParB/RepB/Spo0J family partition protein [SAR324 cluster bacterium]